ncbi:pseudomurein-binding repeat-containing protein [Methanobacterium oryzae]|uniref:pseudomurein-binding repeat-containing protein n=1 Tax=Methanobacterium oryzae TaxID=69540 RepID=UPI003D207A6B
MLLILLSALVISANGVFAAESSVTNNTNVVQAAQLTSTGHSYTLYQVQDAAKRVKVYIETNKKLPAYVTISTQQVKMPDFLYLLVSATVNINSGNTGSISQYSFQNPSSSVESLKSGYIYKSEYINLANQIKSSMATNGNAPSYISTSLGNARYESLIYMYSRIINYYGQNKVLPNYASLNAWTGPVISSPTNGTTNTPKMEIIVSGTGGDVTKNSYIKNNIPSSQITSQVVSLAKSGTPMVTFGNGTGPKVMIIAGVHGNELPAQIAAMKMINYLNGKTIKGTVYIIPFVAPSSTAQNTRLWNGKNLNSVANVAGTPTNQIINKAKGLKINDLGDFHSTQPGGVPGKNSVLCTKSPTYESYNIAKYISSQTGSSLIIYSKAGAEYPGAVEDVSNLAGIPAVTCEVLSSHGVVASGSVDKSYNQMLSLLKYKNIL